MEHAHHAGSQSYGVLLILVLVAALYVRGWLQVHSSNDNVTPLWRAGCFLFGIFLIWVGIASPAASFVHELLTAHMVQHLSLMTVAAPLIWLGEPLKVIMHGLPRNFVRAAIPVLRRPWMQQFGRAITHPAVCWLSASATLVGWHIPALFTLAMESPKWHAFEQASFLVTGLLFWWPVIQPWPSVKRPDWLIVVYLFLATLPCDILSGFLVFCDRVVYPAYVSSAQPFGTSALEDQQFAGALMWTVVTVIYFVVGGILSVRLLSPSRPTQRTMEIA